VTRTTLRWWLLGILFIELVIIGVGIDSSQSHLVSFSPTITISGQDGCSFVEMAPPLPSQRFIELFGDISYCGNKDSFTLWYKKGCRTITEFGFSKEVCDATGYYARTYCEGQTIIENYCTSRVHLWGLDPTPLRGAMSVKQKQYRCSPGCSCAMDSQRGVYCKKYS